MLGNLDDRQVADESLSTPSWGGIGNIMVARSFSLRPGPAARPIPSRLGPQRSGILERCAYQDAGRADISKPWADGS